MGVDSLQYEDDLFDDDGDNDETLEGDLSEPKPSPVIPHKTLPPQFPKKLAGRRLRVRPMTLSMVDKHPDVVSIVLTRNDGRQLVFVRK